MKTKIFICTASVLFQFFVRGAVTPLYSLGNAAGSLPYGELLATNGWLYGTTSSGGSNGASSAGTVFKLATNGTGFTVLKTFSSTTNTGSPQPLGGLILDGETLYGTTSRGVGSGGGVFKINTDGTGFSELCAFGTAGFPGFTPQSGLLLIGSTLFGTTYFNSTSIGWGTLFKMSTNGSGFSVLVGFTNFPTSTNGINPTGALATDGTFIYGAANGGGTHSGGVIYKVGTDGANYSVIHDFDSGAAPQGTRPIFGVIHAGGALYGVAGGGVTLPGIGAGQGGIVYKINTDGSDYTILRAFTNSPDGKTPVGKLLLIGGTLYGATSLGGTNGTGNNSGGTLFKINTDGSGYAVINSFTNFNGLSTGYQGVRRPFTGLTLSDGRLYGTTQLGGTNDNSTVYTLALPPVSPGPPVLQITNANNQPVVFWVYDGVGWNLQRNTNLLSTNWSNVVLNWTNGLNIGLNVTNPGAPPAAFFRLEWP